MNLYVRADANSRIGTGHIMRCLALSQTWQDQGGNVTFISHCESEALKERIQSEGFGFIALDQVCPNSSDLVNTLSILKDTNSDQNVWLVLDGYHFTSEYQKRIKEAGHKILWIDDYGHADHYYADLILNQNISADESFYMHREPYTQLLLGTRYVLLRREFKRWKSWRREIPDIARKVLVTMGGGDSDNVTLKVMQALKQINMPNLEAKIVVGPANPNLEILDRESSDCANLQLIKNASTIPDLMAWADLAVSAGGSTCWEMAFMGLPSLIIVLADNQKPIADKLHSFDTTLSIGWSHQTTIESMSKHIETLLLSYLTRKYYSIKSKALVDGTGAQKVCEVII